MHAATAQAVSALSPTAKQLAVSLRPGRVYRRETLAGRSKAVDRHLRELVNRGRLKKLAQGLYYAPRHSHLGALPPDDAEVVAGFLRDNRFLMFSPSVYNSLGLGTTQLYNRTVVYNHKRHGVFKLGNRHFDFRVKPRFPAKLSPEFLFVDLLNNLDSLAEDRNEVLRQAREKLSTFDRARLRLALSQYGSAAIRKLLSAWLDV